MKKEEYSEEIKNNVDFLDHYIDHLKKGMDFLEEKGNEYCNMNTVIEKGEK